MVPSADSDGIMPNSALEKKTSGPVFMPHRGFHGKTHQERSSIDMVHRYNLIEGHEAPALKSRFPRFIWGFSRALSASSQRTIWTNEPCRSRCHLSLPCAPKTWRRRSCDGSWPRGRSARPSPRKWGSGGAFFASRGADCARGPLRASSACTTATRAGPSAQAVETTALFAPVGRVPEEARHSVLHVCGRLRVGYLLEGALGGAGGWRRGAGSN